jgi:hypothetical protein
MMQHAELSFSALFPSRNRWLYVTSSARVHHMHTLWLSAEPDGESVTSIATSRFAASTEIDSTCALATNLAYRPLWAAARSSYW